MINIIKKIVSSILTILVVACLVFLAFAVIPGDPAVAKLGTQATPDKLAALRHEMGLDRRGVKRRLRYLIQLQYAR